MAKKPKVLELKVASLSGKHKEDRAREVYVDMDSQMIGVLPEHQPEFYKFKAAVVSWGEGESFEKCVVYDGFAQVEPDSVYVAARDIFEIGQLKPSDVESELKELEDELSKTPEEDIETRKKLEREIDLKKALLSKLLSYSG